MTKNTGRGVALSKVYEGAVQSAMLCGAPIWGEGCKVKQGRSLLSAQRILAVKAAAAYRTVSTDAAVVLGRILPFDLLLQETAKRYRLLASRPRDNEINDVQLGNRQIERRFIMEDRTHPADLDNFRFHNWVRDAFEIVYYTDGSRQEDGRYHGETELHRVKFTLADNSSIFQCELVALRQALTHLQGQIGIITECSIVTDSLSVLSALRNMKQPTALQHETWELAVSLATQVNLRFH
ncbi:uncharacterized protein LOC108740128 [Agrilus planipennis]|uniref:Uncharacterized protein LOC108740128 n=1 Tax=Agrilus planipennis TaxID=224129 RepID=A0A1W4XBX2_AGRPL|nr:uncharacterized protein LOC108740128 [Agrilus planipennis]